MEIIVNAGQSRSLCFEALHAARKGNIDEAKNLLKEADGYARKAHQMQTQLIRTGCRRSQTADDIDYGSCSRPFNDIPARPRIIRRDYSSIPAAIVHFNTL
nr:PTS lactose/cellobiose transporter subunit IIA [Pectobacterium colocasium]